ncbi:MAG: hypothetical protein P0Y66_22350 [Candidatus Kaistia colombiensis]|nr:MAG: hypothetical protein P0Y66_22350 [Kaistia sp.]
MPPTVTHWTSRGVFRIEPRILAGSLWCALFLDDQELAVFEMPWTAAKSLHAGDFDDKIGFSAADAGVPADWNAWNRLR